MTNPNPCGGHNHITREPNEYCAPKPVDPNLVNPNNWEGFERSRELLQRAKEAEMELVLLPDGRCEVTFEKRFSVLFHALQREAAYVKAILRGERPARETTGDRTLVKEVF